MAGCAYRDPSRQTRRLRDLVALFGAALGAASVSGIVVAAGLMASSFSSASLVQSWWAWVASHVVSVSAMSPAIAMLGAAAQQPRPMERADTEGAVGLLMP